MDWSPQQQSALAAVAKWRKNRAQQVFRLFGFAGSGKTTMAREFAAGEEGITLFGSFTGKAALVMRQKGCSGAMTLHRMMYLPKERGTSRLRELTGEYEAAKNEADRERLQRLIEDEKRALKRPLFGINPEAPATEADLIIVDEVSMCDDRMADDLQSFGVQLLVLGDPAQLPPVGGEGAFIREDPDVLLTEIHRQAEGSPIIRMANIVRNGGRLDLGEYGPGCSVIPKGMKIQEVAERFDQVIVGRNKTRRAVNHRIRTEVLGRKSHLPEPEDKLICLKNNHMQGLLNGSQWVVSAVEELDEDKIQLDITAFEDDTQTKEVIAHRHIFEDREIPHWDRRQADEFDFGYAITCHKAQGSQWDDVLVVDESGVFRENAQRWLYTAVTRAAETVTVVKM